MASIGSSIFVYILTDDPKSENASRVKSYFSSPIFSVFLTTIDIPQIYANNEEMIESYKFIWCLRDGKKRNPDSFIVIIKDDSITSANPRTIYRIIDSIIKGKGKKYHICYLTRWLDECERHTDRHFISSETSSARTYSPQGLQALMFHPSGRDLLIGERKYRDKTTTPPLKEPLWKTIINQSNRNLLLLRCVIPNLFNAEIKENNDYKKSSECLVNMNKDTIAVPEVPIVMATRINWYRTWYFYFFLFILIILIILALWYLSKRSKMRKNIKQIQE